MAPTPAIKIQPAVEADRHAVLACLAQAFAPYRQCYSAEAFLNTTLCLETIKYRMKNMLVLVAVNQSDGLIVGTVAYNVVNPEEGHLRGMAVLADCQGAGIAWQLLQHAEAELRLLQCSRVTLDTTAPLKASDSVLRAQWLSAVGQDNRLLWNALI
jgi:N-acetylglutamate synthase-like GNAT family acetyltransferase